MSDADHVDIILLDLKEELERLQSRIAHLEALIAVDDPLLLGDYPATDTDAQKLYQFATRSIRAAQRLRQEQSDDHHSDGWPTPRCGACGQPWPCTVARRGVR